MSVARGCLWPTGAGQGLVAVAGPDIEDVATLTGSAVPGAITGTTRSWTAMAECVKALIAAYVPGLRLSVCASTSDPGTVKSIAVMLKKARGLMERLQGLSCASARLG